MSDKLIMQVLVTLYEDEILELESPAEIVRMIPFGGTVRGEIFNGVVLPHGVDTRLIDVNGVNHMCAKYMLEGSDNTGAKCRIYVENNGFLPAAPTSQFKTIPTFYTDSKALAPYLHCNRFRGEGNFGPDGLVISFFEVDAE